MTHVAVITAAAGVSDTLAADIATQLSDAGAVILSERRLGAAGYEIAFDGATPALTAAEADVNILPAANREKRMLIADMDSTMIPVECIDELADFAGLKAEVSDITERAMRGELDFEAALRERVGLLKGLPRAALEQCYAERISLNPGAELLVRTMNARGAVTALVSGGFTFFTSRVAERVGFAINRANTLLFDGDVLSGAVGDPILGREAKLESLNALSAEGGFGQADVIAVGDGANDLAMVEVAGIGVAYHAKPALKAAATATLDHSDLTALLFLQGIAEADFVA
ncbi:phosphoserine phosphatase [Rubricella aquisinus]|uniref:Phosphoserine phosphatase n=1 Tax=Rubricella aquisinus TaxID=2028108 RepID=A0A840WS00_9RHOB|nr:phosphoserine phosphatase SerB [Rubricella aquisinus]MBB5516432.1 phosphoserine phosphatase [Rubricella aquisinus]